LGILKPLEIAVAWIMVQFHELLTALGMPAAGGWTWALSIVGLVVVIRILLIPLFVKQIKASRGLQLIQPEMKKIQAKYKGKSDPASRQAMTQETMDLYKRTGTNPFASCLPILLQAPIFFALFRVLNYGIRNETGIGPLTPELAKQAGESTIFGAKLTDTFLGSPGQLNVQILTVILIILMSASTFLTQKQLMTKNMPAAALDNPFAQQQKILLYALPVIFAVSGVNFPIGMLLYWLTTNVWSMGQQFYVIRRMPAPGSLAEKALQERRARRGLKRGVAPEPEPEPEAPVQPRGQRQQPKRKDRARKTAQAQEKNGAAADAQAPDAQAPDAQAPDAQAPDAQAPDAQAPDAHAPDAQQPGETPAVQPAPAPAPAARPAPAATPGAKAKKRKRAKGPKRRPATGGSASR
jgi:YidC/Oxa1 family membrane protein insertase